MSMRLFRGSLKWIWILTGNSPQPRRVKWNGGSLATHTIKTVTPVSKESQLPLKGTFLTPATRKPIWRDRLLEHPSTMTFSSADGAGSFGRLGISPAEHCDHLFKAAGKLTAFETQKHSTMTPFATEFTCTSVLFFWLNNLLTICTECFNVRVIPWPPVFTCASWC